MLWLGTKPRAMMVVSMMRLRISDVKSRSIEIEIAILPDLGSAQRVDAGFNACFGGASANRGCREPLRRS